MAKNMKILSFDVGIKNLAYCLLEKNDLDFDIIKWGVINLVEDQQKCMAMLKGNKNCEQVAKFTIHNKDQSAIFDNNLCLLKVCSSHKTKLMPKIKVQNKSCVYCQEKAIYELSTNNNCCWCDKHFKTKINIKKISVPNCNKQPIQDLAEKLFSKLDRELEFLNVEQILIENQPTFINPTMKTISALLYSYFVIRGITDKEKTKSKIDIVRFVSPSNKLKVDNETTENTLENTETQKSQIYRMTKKLGIKYCSILINNKSKELLDTYKKKDDMCDAFLQGFQYLFTPIPQKFFDKLKTIGFDDNVKKTKKNIKELAQDVQVNSEIPVQEVPEVQNIQLVKQVKHKKK